MVCLTPRPSDFPPDLMARGEASLQRRSPHWKEEPQRSAGGPHTWSCFSHGHIDLQRFCWAAPLSRTPWEARVGALANACRHSPPGPPTCFRTQVHSPCPQWGLAQGACLPCQLRHFVWVGHPSDNERNHANDRVNGFGKVTQLEGTVGPALSPGPWTPSPAPSHGGCG